MRLAAWSIAGALLVASAAAALFWISRPAVAPKGQQPKHLASPVSATLPQEALKGREVLNKAQLDQAIASGTLDRPVKSLLDVQKPMQFGDYAWNDTAIPAGVTWIRIDLGSQLISVFRAGHEIGTSVIVYGGDNKQTPKGTFHILAKD